MAKFNISFAQTPSGGGAQPRLSNAVMTRPNDRTADLQAAAAEGAFGETIGKAVSAIGSQMAEIGKKIADNQDINQAMTLGHQAEQQLKERLNVIAMNGGSMEDIDAAQQDVYANFSKLTGKRGLARNRFDAHYFNAAASIVPQAKVTAINVYKENTTATVMPNAEALYRTAISERIGSPEAADAEVSLEEYLESQRDILGNKWVDSQKAGFADRLRTGRLQVAARTMPVHEFIATLNGLDVSPEERQKLIQTSANEANIRHNSEQQRDAAIEKALSKQQKISAFAIHSAIEQTAIDGNMETLPAFTPQIKALVDSGSMTPDEGQQAMTLVRTLVDNNVKGRSTTSDPEALGLAMRLRAAGDLTSEVVVTMHQQGLLSDAHAIQFHGQVLTDIEEHKYFNDREFKNNSDQLKNEVIQRMPFIRREMLATVAGQEGFKAIVSEVQGEFDRRVADHVKRFGKQSAQENYGTLFNQTLQSAHGLIQGSSNEIAPETASIHEATALLKAGRRTRQWFNIEVMRLIAGGKLSPESITDPVLKEYARSLATPRGFGNVNP